MAKEKNIDALTYEEAYKELEQIVEKLEGQLSNLDAALELFERGQALAAHCNALLEKAELKVQSISEDGAIADLD